ncbi:MAG: DUF2703 domain-containing protein [Thermanaerothrix sp.]|nr:DUF2703 domain-containing protein [Thermanaerothrix sp.]
MPNIVISHYGIRGVECPHFTGTRDNLLKVVERMAPKFATLGIEISVEYRGMEDLEENRSLHNLITMEAPGEVPETSLESLAGLTVEHEPCEKMGCCRALVMETAKFQEVPSGLVMDGLVRMSMRLIGGCSSDGCGSCSCH